MEQENIKNIELNILSYFLRRIDYIISALSRDIMPENFKDIISQDFFRIVYEHYCEYSNVITRETFYAILDDAGANDAVKSIYKIYFDKVEALKNQPENNFDFWVDLFFKHVYKSKLVTTIQTSVDKLSVNDIDGAFETLSNVTMQTRKGVVKPGYSIQETADQRWLDYIDRKENPEKYKGILTLIYEFDCRMNGFKQGEDLAVFVARTGVGKSITLSVIAKNLFLAGYDGILAGVEMSPESNIMRIDSSLADLCYDHIRDGKLAANEEEIYHSLLTNIKSNKNILHLTPQELSKTPKLLEFEIKNFIKKYERSPQFLVVDYINIMTIEDPKGLNSGQIQKSIAEELKALGEKYNLVIFTAAQQTRDAVKGKVMNKNYKPGSESVALSDFIGNTATFVAILEETEEDELNGMLTVSVVKCRFGDRKVFKLRKNWKRMYLGDADDTI